MTYNRDIIKRIKRLASVCLCLLASLCVYLLASSTLYAAHQVKDGILSHITDTVACRQWVDSQLKQMTLKQLATAFITFLPCVNSTLSII